MNNYWLKYHMSKMGNSDYVDGIKAGIDLYAYMKDGVSFVGTTGRTYQEAIVEVDFAHEWIKEYNLKQEGVKDGS